MSKNSINTDVTVHHLFKVSLKSIFGRPQCFVIISAIISPLLSALERFDILMKESPPATIKGSSLSTYPGLPLYGLYT